MIIMEIVKHKLTPMAHSIVLSNPLRLDLWATTAGPLQTLISHRSTYTLLHRLRHGLSKLAGRAVVTATV